MHRLGMLVVKLLLAAGNAGIWLVHSLLFTRKVPEELKRVAIFKVGHIGDIACAIPAMWSIRERFADAHDGGQPGDESPQALDRCCGSNSVYWCFARRRPVICRVVWRPPVSTLSASIATRDVGPIACGRSGYSGGLASSRWPWHCV